MTGFAELVESGKASAGELAGEMNGVLRALELAELAGNIVLFAEDPSGFCSGHGHSSVHVDLSAFVVCDFFVVILHVISHSLL